ncbi:CDP-Glycerol:Poly(glycerophosphate) glycerophosphotransferase [Friedmanniella luteola]|uniref:CDP-Glycerol:Poly(Glycerophosphate) glycerophosphotransferase n=1 Tax=Friedmanniella luteola TaxID=546871 RepID=A0A1H1ZBX5_9ACTN|nr:CDP-glycerol glycerophosphotransferase family protein [Friedmanniella luteola]SDT30706.1 CDP-Glycerol:Poly(glycerophosphate) glycerophosphotransferase [Friedmanniella luteola]
MRAPALPTPALTRPLRRVARLAHAAATRAANEVNAPRFARQAARRAMLPNGAVVVFFATGPENLYQFEQWRLPLEELAEQRPVLVVVDRADTGEAVHRRSRLPVTLARGSAALETLVAERDVRVVLYLNQVEPNFRMLRFAAPVHVQLGHGESDKASSVSNQHKAYDLTFVGGPAGSARLGAALRGFDPAERTVQVGRPQLDHAYPGAPDWPADGRRRVLYAPTWEGDRPSIAYGSLASHGVPLVEALLAGGARVVYRPHPRTGAASAAHATADRRVRELLGRAGEDHLVDTGPYGWQWTFADACVTDVSAIAYDWLATGKPLVVTEPVRTASRPPSALLDRLPLLAAVDAGAVLGRLAEQDPALLAALTRHYFGETAGRASTARFLAAVEACYALPGAEV